jgi:hypothetical protein
MLGYCLYTPRVTYNYYRYLIEQDLYHFTVSV